MSGVGIEEPEMGTGIKSILISNGTVWNGMEYKKGNVALKDGKIADIGACEGFQADYEYDASGAVVCPGLVDIHTHLKGVGPDIFGVLPEASSYPFGVTAAAEAGGEKTEPVEENFHLKTAIFAVVGYHNGRPVFDRAERVISAHEGRIVGIKTYYDKGQTDVDSVEPFREVCEYAHGRGYRVMVHCTNSPVPLRELFSCMRKGDICTHVYHGIGHTAAEDGFEALREARERGIILDTGLAGGAHGSYEIIRQALAAGLGPDTISTDITRLSAFHRGGNYGMTMAMSIMRYLGMSDEAVLRAVTSDAAGAIGRQEEWGMLLPGRAADTAVLKYGPVQIDSTDRNGCRIVVDEGYRCVFTVADGWIVYRGN